MTTIPKPLNLDTWHNHFENSVRWRLTQTGVEIKGRGIERTPGPPLTVTRIWSNYSTQIEKWAAEYFVPIELIVATIATESSGNPKAVRKEPGFVSEQKTPSQISAGLMQTLLSTARESMKNPNITIDWLFTPENSIQAGTAYIARQYPRTHYDPPLVAAAYNTGGLVPNNSPKNRWRLLQYPAGTSAHVDRFIKFFNDFYALANSAPIKSELTFLNYLKETKNA